MQSDTTFFDVFAGGIDTAFFLSYVLWGYIGMGVNLFIELTKRKPSSKSSPKKFKGIYYWDDNKKRLVISLILVPVGVLLFSEFFGIPLTNERALMLGLGADNLAELIKRRSMVSPDVKNYE